MDEKIRSRKEKELTDLYAEVQKMRAESNSKLQTEVAAARAPIIKKVQEIANKIGREDKYDFIVEKSVLYFAGNDKDDLTKRVTAELDKSH
jgi:Skp family chaperone for outer membrane proteins